MRQRRWFGVTSHRNVVAHEEADVCAHVRELFSSLRRALPQLPLTVLSPLAEGGDQWMAEVALSAGARLIAPLPMARMQYAQVFHRAKTARLQPSRTALAG